MFATMAPSGEGAVEAARTNEDQRHGVRRDDLATPYARARQRCVSDLSPISRSSADTYTFLKKKSEYAGESFIMADALPGAAAAPVSALPGRGSRAHASSGLASSGASGPPKHLDVAVSPTTPHTFDALPRKATTLEHMQKSQAGERSAARCEVGSSAAVSATSAQGGRADPVSRDLCMPEARDPR